MEGFRSSDFAVAGYSFLLGGLLLLPSGLFELSYLQGHTKEYVFLVLPGYTGLLYY